MPPNKPADHGVRAANAPAAPAAQPRKTFMLAGTTLDADLFAVVNKRESKIDPRVDIAPSDMKYVARLSADSAFICEGILKKDQTIPREFEPEVSPNALGLPPVPSDLTLLPPDSRIVIVGTGKFTTTPKKPKEWTGDASWGYRADSIQHGFAVHEQYWRRSANSFSLAPMQQKTVFMEQVSGVTNFTGTTEELALSVGVGASGGFDGISASFSAALNYTTSVSRSVTLQNQTTTSMQDVVRNGNAAESVSVVHWELIDLYKVFVIDKDGRQGLLAMIEHVQAPTVIRVYPEGATLAQPI